MADFVADPILPRRFVHPYHLDEYILGGCFNFHNLPNDCNLHRISYKQTVLNLIRRCLCLHNTLKGISSLNRVNAVYHRVQIYLP